MVTLTKGNGFHRFTWQTIHLLDPVKKVTEYATYACMKRSDWLKIRMQKQVKHKQLH